MLFTLVGAVRCQVLKRLCIAKTCILRWDGKSEYIFRLSTETCAGDELGWDYIACVLHNSRPTFSGFCNIKNDEYSMRNNSCKKFMSPPTFEKWFLTWASHLKGKFTGQKLCCGTYPTMLAGDGTKIGIQPSRQLQNERRYKNDLPIKEPLHRYDRTFFRYFRDPGNVNPNESLRILRTNTANFCSSVLGSGQFIDQTVFNDAVLEGFPARAWPLFSRLLNGEMDKRESKLCADLFLLLCKDASLSSILPVKLLPLLDTYLLNVSEHTMSTVADALEMVCPEISLCIMASAYSNEEKMVPKQDVS